MNAIEKVANRTAKFVCDAVAKGFPLPATLTLTRPSGQAVTARVVLRDGEPDVDVQALLAVAGGGPEFPLNLELTSDALPSEPARGVIYGPTDPAEPVN